MDTNAIDGWDKFFIPRKRTESAEQLEGGMRHEGVNVGTSECGVALNQRFH